MFNRAGRESMKMFVNGIGAADSLQILAVDFGARTASANWELAVGKKQPADAALIC
jgi:hypothetical protein